MLLRGSLRRRAGVEPVEHVLEPHDPDAVAAVGLVVTLREADDRRHPTAHKAVQVGGVTTAPAQVLEPVGAVAYMDDVRARWALDERADQEAAGVRDVVLDRPTLSYEAVERAAGSLVVDGETEHLVADGEGLGNV